MTTRTAIFKYIEDNFGVTPEFPFKKYPRYAALKNRHGKWFGLVMNVPAQKLGLSGTTDLEILDIKVDPEFGELLRSKPGFLPAYHMNKEHWLSMVLDKATDEALLFQLLDDSYNLVINN